MLAILAVGTMSLVGVMCSVVVVGVVVELLRLRKDVSTPMVVYFPDSRFRSPLREERVDAGRQRA